MTKAVTLRELRTLAKRVYGETVRPRVWYDPWIGRWTVRIHPPQPDRYLAAITKKDALTAMVKDLTAALPKAKRKKAR